MTLFRVWAPLAGCLELTLGEMRHPMVAREGGWWSVDVPDAEPGTDYAFVLDGGPPLPDPRSPWQAQGIHGPSRVVDHAAFRWTDAAWQAPPLASAVISEVHVYDRRYSAFRRRRHGRVAVGLSGHRFVVCLQNHDQIGNRARGERTSHLVGADRLKIGAALLLTAPFVPLLFQGEEWAASAPFQYFTDHEDPELARAIREGRRREFAAFGGKLEEIPDPQAPETFERSKLDWGELSLEPHRSVLDWHRQLIRLRRELPGLRDGRLDQTRVRFDEAARWLVLDRGSVSVACNFLDQSVRIPFEGPAMRVRLASDARVNLLPAGLELPPVGVAVLGHGRWSP